MKRDSQHIKGMIAELKRANLRSELAGTHSVIKENKAKTGRKMDKGQIERIKKYADKLKDMKRRKESAKRFKRMVDE